MNESQTLSKSGSNASGSQSNRVRVEKVSGLARVGAPHTPAWVTEGRREQYRTQVVHLDAAARVLPGKSVAHAVYQRYRLDLQLGGTSRTSKVLQEDDLGPFRAVGELIGCGLDEIAFAPGATSALRIALSGLRSLRYADDPVFLVDQGIYGANIWACTDWLVKRGYIEQGTTQKVTYNRAVKHIITVPADEKGRVSLPALQDLLRRYDKSIVAVIMTDIPTIGGVRNPISDIGKMVREHGQTMIADCAQSLQAPINMREMNCDLAVFAFYKHLGSPPELGGLYKNREWKQGTLPDTTDANYIGHSISVGADGYFVIDLPSGIDPIKAYQSWQADAAKRKGLEAAIDFLKSKTTMPEAWERVKALARWARQEISTIPGAQLWGNNEDISSIVSAYFEGYDPPINTENLVDILSYRFGINMDNYPYGICPGLRHEELVRMSPFAFSTSKEITYAVNKMKYIIRRREDLGNENEGRHTSRGFSQSQSFYPLQSGMYGLGPVHVYSRA